MTIVERITSNTSSDYPPSLTLTLLSNVMLTTHTSHLKPQAGFYICGNIQVPAGDRELLLTNCELICYQLLGWCDFYHLLFDHFLRQSLKVGDCTLPWEVTNNIKGAGGWIVVGVECNDIGPEINFGKRSENHSHVPNFFIVLSASLHYPFFAG